MINSKSPAISQAKPIIGIIEPVSIGKHAIDVPAKIDTGADSSSIWASNIRVGRDGILRFSLFGEGSEYYNGEILKHKDYSTVKVKNSTGHVQYRYSTSFTIRIAGKKIRVRFNLSDRSNNTFKILIGRRTIHNKFVVDVSKGHSKLPTRSKKNNFTTRALQTNPYEFYKKYIKPQQEGSSL